MAEVIPGSTENRTSSERRIITVRFCDVVSSTEMAERLDPEEWTEIMNEAFQYLTAPISRYEGTVSRLVGDAVLVFFGAPVAHEDDPQRAELGQGEVFGEMALLDKWTRSASVRTLEDTTCVGIDRWLILAQLRKELEVAIAMLQVLVRRLRETDARLTE